MTKEEIRKFLDNTKVYVNGKSKEIQEKLFSFGYVWYDDNHTEVCNEGKPFLFICKDGDITYSNDMCYFVNHKYREITAEETLALKITEPSYRPFRDNKECWQEMMKHQPFGWLKSIRKQEKVHIGRVFEVKDFALITLSINEGINNNSSYFFNEYTFADGTPFGIKED